MKKAFFVLGVESSGTRMLTRALISAGCYGDGDHQQRLDTPDFNNLPDKIVLRRSIPHAGGVPDVEGWLNRFRYNGYEPVIIKIYRDKECNVKSMMKRGHANSRNIAVTKYQAGTALMDRYYGLEVNYRKFVTDKEYRKERFEQLGLPEPKMEFFNGDAKWTN